VLIVARLTPGEYHFCLKSKRELCRKKDRLEVCDVTLGQILAHSPVGQDGIWPFEAVREILDRPDLEDMHQGFMIGIINKRGMVSRALDAGGTQERKLAAKYRAYANALRTSHPKLAAILDSISESYEQEGMYEDLKTRLHMEGIE